MSNSNSNKIMVPNAREAMDKFKMEAANDLAVAVPSLNSESESQRTMTKYYLFR